jgi:diguanylate cyclase (GGDEF)-like protein
MKPASEISIETSPLAAFRGMVASLRERLARRPDKEHQAALIRIVLALIASCYLIVATQNGFVASTHEPHVMVLIAVTITYSIAVFISILVHPQICVPRRILSIFFDIGATTYALYFLDGLGTPFFGIYLWNSIGNGFRFGVRYLYLSSVLGVLGFAFVITKNEYWSVHQALGVGLIIALVALPAYMSSLVRQLHAALAHMRTIATHDSLTGLPNRHLFYEHLQHTLKLAEQSNVPFAVVFVDLDNFKPVNDVLGHAIGDTVLKSVAQRLKESVRKNDLIARFGGDEFVIILSDAQKTVVSSVACKILDTVARPHEIDGQTVTLSSSLGIATFPDDGQSVDELVARADAAMYRSKRSGRNCFCLSGETQTVNNLSAHNNGCEAL